MKREGGKLLKGGVDVVLGVTDSGAGVEVQHRILEREERWREEERGERRGAGEQKVAGRGRRV